MAETGESNPPIRNILDPDPGASPDLDWNYIFSDNYSPPWGGGSYCAGQLGDKERENSFEHNLHLRPSELGGDEIIASGSGVDEVLSEPSSYVSEKNREVNFQLPNIGMEFPSEEAAYEFYRNYAEETGFTVRKGKVQRLANGTIRKRYFFCSKQGFRLKTQRETKYKRKETRIGCPAMIQFTVENEKWVISQFCATHNHDGIIPIIPIISEAEAGTVSEAGRFHSMAGLQPKDGESLINYLEHLKRKDPSIFYRFQADGENRITNFFWTDGRSKIDYYYFSDIIILDTTFRMSIYDMICAPFWGVNHHRQYILFGCAFLLGESVDSLNWLLNTFMKVMGRRQPKTIVTDESEVMAKAIEVTLPKTQHCLSLQYICQNARKHFSAYFEQAGFERLFNKCIFDCQSVEEFESMWESLLEQHNLGENSWLNRIYMLRDKWSHAFCKKTFSAGIQSNHGSESINNVFQNVVGEMTLPKFVEQYESEAQRRCREESFEDFHCKGIASSPTWAIEKQAAITYTSTMFKIFQGELQRSLSVAIEEIANDCLTVATFKITEEGEEKGNHVKFNILDSIVTCSCGKFETIGILCVHALKVLSATNIFLIPPQYVLKRWTKKAKEGFVEDEHGADREYKRFRPKEKEKKEEKKVEPKKKKEPKRMKVPPPPPLLPMTRLYGRSPLPPPPTEPEKPKEPKKKKAPEIKAEKDEKPEKEEKEKKGEKPEKKAEKKEEKEKKDEKPDKYRTRWLLKIICRGCM